MRVWPMTFKNPWFWFALVGLVLVGIIVWKALSKPRTTSIGVPQSLPPPGHAPTSFSQNVNAIAGLGKVAESIFSDIYDN